MNIPDTDRIIEMYQNDYSIPYLSNHFGIDRRKVVSIIERSSIRRRRSKKSKGKAYSRRTKKEREERLSIIPKSENRGKLANGEIVNSKQEWIFLSVNRGCNSSKALFDKDDCPYSSKSSLGNAIRKLKSKGMLDYPETVSGSKIEDIVITQWGMKRIYEPTTAEQIIHLHKLYPHLDYVDLADAVGCNRSYPHKVLSIGD